MRGGAAMSNTYLDPYDTDNPPHVTGAEGGSITEVSDRSQWSRGQRALVDWHAGHARGEVVPSDTPIDPLSPLFGLVHKLGVDRDRDDFRYVIYGRTVAKHANMGMEGRWVSELVEPARGLFLEHYRDLLTHPRLFVGRLYYSGPDVRYRAWNRAVAPLGSPERGVTHFIVFTEVVELANAV